MGCKPSQDKFCFKADRAMIKLKRRIADLEQAVKDLMLDNLSLSELAGGSSKLVTDVQAEYRARIAELERELAEAKGNYRGEGYPGKDEE